MKKASRLNLFLDVILSDWCMQFKPRDDREPAPHLSVLSSASRKNIGGQFIFGVIDPTIKAELHIRPRIDMPVMM